MEYGTDKILEISLAKFDQSKITRKQSSTSSKLHRNLLVSSVLRAIKIDSDLTSEDCLMDYRESKLIDIDLDESTKEIPRREMYLQKNKTMLGPEYKVHECPEWKPRACDGGCRESTDDHKLLSSNSKINKTECSTIKDLHCFASEIGSHNLKPVADVEEKKYLKVETALKEQEIRKLSAKRPRDQNSDMNRVPKPNKISKVYDACDRTMNSPTQEVSSLESLFRDSFTDLMDTTENDSERSSLHLHFALPLVTIMAC
eukprot:gene15781-17374_t